MWGSEPSPQWETLFGIIFLLWVCGSPPLAGHDCAPSTTLLQLLLSLDMGHFLWWISGTSCWWLSNSQLQFWCSHRKRWTHILLLCHLLNTHWKWVFAIFNVSDYQFLNFTLQFGVEFIRLISLYKATFLFYILFSFCPVFMSILSSLIGSEFHVKYYICIYVIYNIYYIIEI